MNQLNQDLLWLFIVIQFCGCVSAALARLGIGTMLQAWGHLFFLLNMLLIGLATAWCVMIGSQLWLWSGGTLSVMILIAVLDVRTPAWKQGLASR